MPELPEVETVCRGLSHIMKGHRLQRLILRRKDLRTPFPPGMDARAANRQVLNVERRAKYILIHLSGGKTLLAHLGMSGRMSQMKEGHVPGPHEHVIFEMKNGARIVFCDPRRFGMMDLVNTAELSAHKLLRGIGPEPLGKTLHAAYLEKAFKGRKPAVKIALMDQRLIAGVGNIYASEALFYAGINPRKAAGRLTRGEIEKLVPAIKKVLKASIAHGGSSLRDYAHADGGLGSFQDKFAVYDRAGKPCKNCICDLAKTGGVQHITQGGRSTFYCPVKQA